MDSTSQVDGALAVMQQALAQAAARGDTASVVMNRERIDTLLDARNAGTLATHPEKADTLPKQQAGRHAA